MGAFTGRSPDLKQSFLIKLEEYLVRYMSTYEEYLNLAMSDRLFEQLETAVRDAGQEFVSDHRLETRGMRLCVDTDMSYWYADINYARNSAVLTTMKRWRLPSLHSLSIHLQRERKQ